LKALSAEFSFSCAAFISSSTEEQINRIGEGTKFIPHFMIGLPCYYYFEVRKAQVDVIGLPANSSNSNTIGPRKILLVDNDANFFLTK
jgi:hypothetical protein